mgnify:CR=1 FL=1
MGKMLWYVQFPLTKSPRSYERPKHRDFVSSLCIGSASMGYYPQPFLSKLGRSVSSRYADFEPLRM